MGPSGSGKTTLLNILSDRTNIGAGSKLTGKVLINDKIPFDSKIFGKIAAYVM
jgi:ABC-type multidrug transport system ATPase subunit